MTANDITKVLAINHWNFLKQIIVPRCKFAGSEADLLVLYPNNWLEEIEIKISSADFKREFKAKKTKHKRLVYGIRKYREKGYNNHLIHKFWFAMPLELANYLVNDIPDYAGLISIEKKGNKFMVNIVKEAPVLNMGRKLTDKERIKLMRLAYIRFWNKENLKLMNL